MLLLHADCLCCYCIWTVYVIITQCVYVLYCHKIQIATIHCLPCYYIKSVYVIITWCLCYYNSEKTCLPYYNMWSVYLISTKLCLCLYHLLSMSLSHMKKSKKKSVSLVTIARLSMLLSQIKSLSTFLLYPDLYMLLLYSVDLIIGTHVKIVYMHSFKNGFKIAMRLDFFFLY